MTRPPVDVRRAGTPDVDDLLLLWLAAREEMGRGARSSSADPDTVRARLVIALQEDALQLVIARWAGKPAGYALMHTAALAPLMDGVVLHVEHLFVLPELRRHGIARALLSAVAGTAERYGADQVITGAPPGARETHRYLARLGFSPILVRRVVATAVLRRRLAGESRRGGLEDLLSRRRSLRARASRPAWRDGAAFGGIVVGDLDVDDDIASAVPTQPPPQSVADTLEMPLVSDADLFSDSPAHQG